MSGPLTTPELEIAREKLQGGLAALDAFQRELSQTRDHLTKQDADTLADELRMALCQRVVAMTIGGLTISETEQVFIARSFIQELVKLGRDMRKAIGQGTTGGKKRH